MSLSELSDVDLVSRIRRFNRYYALVLGLLRSRYLGGPLGYGEARALFEVGNSPGCRAMGVGQTLGLDRGYLSRLLAALHKKGLIKRRPDPTDRRSTLLYLTSEGRSVWEDLNHLSNELVRALLDGLPVREQADLVQAMDRIVEILDSRAPQPD